MPAIQTAARSIFFFGKLVVTGLNHGMSDDRGIVNVRVRAIAELEGPAAAGQVGAPDSLVTGLVPQLLACEPAQG
jgi:hypothetical protein